MSSFKKEKTFFLFFCSYFMSWVLDIPAGRFQSTDFSMSACRGRVQTAPVSPANGLKTDSCRAARGLGVCLRGTSQERLNGRGRGDALS
jgi:hypothetical protein